MARTSVFRRYALQRLQDPEQLDSAVRLTSPKGWLALAVIGGIIVCVVIWAVVGRVPFRSQGFGVLLPEHSALYDVVANGSGSLGDLPFQVGDHVTAGQLIAVIELPDQEIQIAGAQRTLDALQEQYDIFTAENEADIAERRDSTAGQVEALRQKIAADRQRLDFLSNLLDDQEADLALGYITREDVEDTLTQLHEARQNIVDNENQILTLQIEQVEFENQQRSSMLQLRQQIVDQQNTLAELDVETETSRNVLSPVDGTVVGIAAKPGAFVNPGDEIVEIEEAGGDLRMIAYFSIQQGKKLAPGMEAEVSPTSIERDIYGTISGKVVSVGEFPETAASLQNTLANQTLVDEMMEDGAPIQVIVELAKDTNTVSGFAWSSSAGPPVKLSPSATASVAVTVVNVSPISLLLPIVQTWFSPSSSQ